MAIVVSFSDECVNAAQTVKRGKAIFCIFVVEGNTFEIHEMGERMNEKGKENFVNCKEQ